IRKGNVSLGSDGYAVARTQLCHAVPCTPDTPRLSMKQHKQKLYKHFSSARYGCTIDRHASIN
ncbi:hypothetical protein, partial [Barnesiella intestinihominis]|uniref:hypothetical protein n=1 Tax=Barnesiella intestinihominis TaxID=487174 RepID=UPI003AB835E7